MRPSYAAPPYEPPSRSIKPSEPRNRAIFATVCAAVFGTFVISAVVRTCSGEDFWEKPKQSAPAPKVQSEQARPPHAEQPPAD